jgi:hypothetical protein
MSELAAVEKSTNPYAKQFLIAATLTSFLVLGVYFLPALRPFRLPLAYCLPFVLAYGLILGFRVYHTARDPLPIVPFLTGAVFVIGGAAFDGIATLIKSSTLSRESNPIARALLDAGHSSNFVILYGVITQVVFLTLVCVLWAAFLIHRHSFLALVKSKEAKSSWGFIKAALGGGHLSWRQFLFPLKLAEFPTSYYLLWLVPVIFVWGSFMRWYWGFRWLGMIPLPVAWAIGISLGLPTVGYFAWLWLAYSREGIPPTFADQ